jgi:hypothetical protein
MNAAQQTIDNISDWCKRDNINLEDAVSAIECMFDEDFVLIKSSHECNSSDIILSSESSLIDCSKLCRNMDDCNFFIHGGFECRMEKTLSPICEEGFTHKNRFSFYANIPEVTDLEEYWDTFRSIDEMKKMIVHLEKP